MRIRTRAHVRRSPHATRRERPEILSRLGREPSLRGPGAGRGPALESVLDDVKAGTRNGYTWTLNWKFDLDDPADMELVYNALGHRAMYVLATTNRTLEQWEGPEAFNVLIGASEGVGIWRNDAGQVYVDNIVLLIGPKRMAEGVTELAKSYSQKYFVEIDGRARKFKLVEVA